MSEVMLLGVLRMPPETWTGDPLDVAQRHSYYRAAADIIQHVVEHNNACDTLCGIGDQEGVQCGYRPYFPRRCTRCPKYDKIEL